MKILLTGSNGLLGQKIVAKCINDPSIELLATSKGENRISLFPVNYQSLDITNEKEVREIVSKFQPDVIINTAAMTNVDACESAKDEAWKLNVVAVENLLKVSEENNIHLIHLSTDFIFDGENGPYKEDDEPCPVSYYGETKLEAEKLLLESSYNNWAIARTIIVYGIAEKMSRSNLVLWAKGALEKGQNIKVVNDQFRSPTLAEDLAEGCLLIAKKHATGVFHISGEVTESIYDLVSHVASYWGADISLIEAISSTTLNQDAKRPPRTGFDISKAKTELGYQPHSFTEGLQIIDEQLKSGNY